MRLACERGHHFVADPIVGRRSVVVDLGAHRGEFSRRLHEAYGAECHAVEPNPELLRAMSVRNGIAIYPYAIAGRDGPVALRCSENPEASSIVERLHDPDLVGTVSVEGTTLVSFLQRANLRRVDLLKVDVEGAEYQMFASTPDEVLRAIPQITVEFHDRPDAPRRIAMKEVAEHLGRLGFGCIDFSRRFDDVLFLHRESLGVGPVAFWWLALVSRNVRGLGRSIRRFTGRAVPERPVPC